MRYLVLTVLTVFILTATSCQKPAAPYTVVFCASLGENDECIGENNHFPPETRVFVRCNALKPFPYDYVVGAIYEMREGKKNGLIAQQSFALKVQDTHVSYFLPFDQYKGKGEFLIEFSEPKGEILAASTVYLEN
ncbi:MAG: hypothetical protein SF052_16365 [Bacteroidia bacterium]|nr:hypothetical protein [Bacteroidia bacterium]